MELAQQSLDPKARPAAPLRFISAASLFDGHDAAINMVRRLLQAHGAEVVHLGHNRSVSDIVRAAIQEDADAVAVSSYQGGHNEYFRYMVDMLREQGAEHIRIIVGGGGTIAPDEIAALEAYGVEKIYSAEEGMRLGLAGMTEDVFARVRRQKTQSFEFGPIAPSDHGKIARAISALEAGDEALRGKIAKALARAPRSAPIVGVTGTGGAGKSSLTDELLQRFTRHFPERSAAIVAMDPTRRRSGGALLGDRIRMNALTSSQLFMRSLATRRANRATSAVLGDVLDLLKFAGFDLIIVETAGIGQSESEIADLTDVALYVMTSDYGAASQLEKIDMLDFSDIAVVNKFEKRGSQDALRDVRKQWRRNHPDTAKLADDALPVFPTIASRFNDPGVNRFFVALCEKLGARDGRDWTLSASGPLEMTEKTALIPEQRTRYLAEIAAQGRQLQEETETRAIAARRAQSLHDTLVALDDKALRPGLSPFNEDELAVTDGTLARIRREYNLALDAISDNGRKLLSAWPAQRDALKEDSYSYPVRDSFVKVATTTQTLSHQKVPRIALPSTSNWDEQLRFLMAENLPGAYPYTAGVYPFRREEENPARMFAGEGGPERTNRRFHYLARGHKAKRLSTAFDSTTLYGEDPDRRPDIYGRIGNSGVSIASLDDMKKLYSGFDLCAPETSVSMTINGPAPAILAMFMNTAIDQQVERYLKQNGKWDATEKTIAAKFANTARPTYRGPLPEGHDGYGLGLLGVSGDEVLPHDIYENIKKEALARVRGTVQADILKEDQAQNTCIFSTEFALRMMGDVQEYFIANKVRNFYSVSISGYHIAEAGANPITQLAFTLANGFTIVEYYLARGMAIDDFAPNLSFFFSNGMDPEYAVIGRVARRIWARAMRERYGADARSQMLKYHIQTSGRSLHAREIQFNDIRTTLQALYALADNCNSLHTNAYDEALTTPTEESVRRALAIQLIIGKELGLTKTENPLQGSYLLSQLTDLVEEAVYQEFDRLSERGGVLGAMETMYQRLRIQEESMYYEGQKHEGSLPIIGVNTFVAAEKAESEIRAPLIRATHEEQEAQVENVQALLARGHHHAALVRLQQAAAAGENVFAALMETVKVASLGTISHALYQSGGQYRRSM